MYFDVPERGILQLLQMVDYSRTEEGVEFTVNQAATSELEGSNRDELLEIQVGTLIDEGFPHKGVIDFLSA